MGRIIWKSPLITAAVLLNLLYLIYASPVPVAHPVAHPFASFTTTNSFLYSNNLGTFNYRFTKPNLSLPYTKYLGYPQAQLSSTEHDNPQFSNLIRNTQLVPLGKKPILNKVRVFSENDSTGLSQVSKFPAFSLDLQPGAIDQENKGGAIEYETKTGNGSRDEDAALTYLEEIQNEPLPENRATSTTPHNTPMSEISSVYFSNNANKPSPDLESLFKKVINAPFRNVAPSVLTDDAIPYSRNEDPTGELPDAPLQNRQGSTFEHPTTFFAPETPKLSSQSHPQQDEALNEVSRPGQVSEPDNRFQPFSTPQKQAPQPAIFSQLFSGINRFSLPQNENSHIPNRQTPYLQQHPSVMSNDNFRAPTPPTSSPSQPPVHPFQAQLPLSQFNPSLAPPPGGPEPENGFNPFHLHENYPEPPYESEFGNDIPLSDEVDPFSEEQSPRSAGRQSEIRPLDFAQSTLRNVATEELLQVVRRKPVPPECVYNSISYGANGEDCIEARRKRHTFVAINN